MQIFRYKQMLKDVKTSSARPGLLTPAPFLSVALGPVPACRPSPGAAGETRQKTGHPMLGWKRPDPKA